ncbi:MAG: ABC transporter permease [Balneolaceae bacterium]
MSNLNSVVLSQKAARKYFGDENPVGKILQIRKKDIYEDFEVTGLIENIPNNSTIKFDILLSIKEEGFYTGENNDNWGMSIYQTFVLLNDNVSPSRLNSQLDTFFDKYHEGYSDSYRERNGWQGDARPLSYRLRPLHDIHLSTVSDPLYSYILSGIAFGILFIACINFMTLSIGRSSKRSKEIGMRKVVGANRHQLMFQFWGEAFIICIISLITGLLLAELLLPVFNSLSGKELSFNYFDNWVTVSVLMAFIILTGFIAGSYPAVVLSRVKPVVTLTGMLKLNGSNLFTKSLVVVQFSLSFLLIVGTLVMKNQLDFIQERDLGFNKEQVVTIPLDKIDGAKLAGQLRNTLLKNANIIGLTTMGNSLGRSGSYGYGIEYNGKNINLNVFTVENNYTDFLGLKIVDGRGFDVNLVSDSTEAVLVNETLVREMELENPVGMTLPGINGGEHAGAIIIGVVSDHNFQSLYTEMQPAFFTLNTAWGFENLMIRIHSENIQESIAEISTSWRQFVPEIPFSYSFLDDNLQEVYRNDLRWSKVINYSSFFAILIACMGLFGLVTLSVNSRQKEVGIRKVLGASIPQITRLFAKDFVKLVIIGAFIASPIAYYFMSEWLVNFAYRISIKPSHFIMAMFIVLLIAVVTISFQTIKAGLTNPADTLMNE